MKKILSVDFDGTIHSYENGWQGGKIYGTVIEGFFDWAIRVVEHDYEIHVFSSRSSDPKLKKEMEDWLEDKFSDFCRKHNVAVTEQIFYYPTSKPKAFLTIDDRSILFNGSWDDLQFHVLNKFVPWNKHKEKTKLLNVLKYTNKVLSEAAKTDNSTFDNDSYKATFVRNKSIPSIDVNFRDEIYDELKNVYYSVYTKSRPKDRYWNYVFTERFFRIADMQQIICIITDIINSVECENSEFDMIKKLFATNSYTLSEFFDEESVTVDMSLQSLYTKIKLKLV